jgi:hypothetical protein
MLVSRPGPIPAPGNAAAWFYRANDQNRGPVAESQIRALVEAGMLRPTDLVWREGMPEWVEIQSVPGLCPRSLVKPPPVPPPVAAVAVARPQTVAVAPPHPAPAPARTEETKECPFCASTIHVRAKICRDCGETVDVALRAAEEAKREAKAARRRGDDGPGQPVVVYHGEPRRFPHALHLILTILTVGLWLPIWIIHYVIWELS